MHNILLVEDNIAIQKINKEFLEEAAGYSVRLAMNLAEARKHVAMYSPCLIVLDIMLPDGSGLDFLRELRKSKRDIPVLLLTALSEVNDEIKCLRAGGDDYISKPYDAEVLLTRIQTRLRQKRLADERMVQAVRQAVASTDTLKFGPLTINTVSQRAALHGEDINLRPKEFLLLMYFLKNINKKLTTEQLYKAVWGQEACGSVNTVRVRIKDLRRKLRSEDELAVTIDTVERKYYVCRVVK